jgi:hypothetical protein
MWKAFFDGLAKATQVITLVKPIIKTLQNFIYKTHHIFKICITKVLKTRGNLNGVNLETIAEGFLYDFVKVLN